MSKSFVKLVDNSLLPAAVMILGKFIGVMFAIQVFNLPWTIREYSDNIFTLGATFRPEDVAIATSYSDLIMYLFLSVIFTFTVLRAVFLHNTHVKPTLVVKLANHDMLDLIKNSYDIYHTSFVWLIFTWISNILVLVNMFSGRTYVWIGITCTIASLVLTTILFQDVYREIENIRKHPGEYQWS